MLLKPGSSSTVASRRPGFASQRDHDSAGPAGDRSRLLRTHLGNRATTALLQRCGMASCACGPRPSVDGDDHLPRDVQKGSAPQQVYRTLNDAGHSMDAFSRNRMETLFAEDFSSVRIHTGSLAEESADSVDAAAYTVGSHIVFGRGQFAPHTSVGRALLAHELTHVVQQRPVGRSDAPLKVTSPEDPAERDAEAVAATAERGIPAVASDAQRAPVVARAPRPSRSLRATIAAEDVAGIVSEQMDKWYTNSRLGMMNASLSGEDQGLEWFLFSLAGNLVWASTAFVAPEAVMLIRVMSVGGSIVGSGTLERLLKDEAPIEAFRNLAADSLGATYSRMQSSFVPLINGILTMYEKGGLTDRTDATQADHRRRAAWKYLFANNIGYDNPRDLENNTKHDVEAIWRDFFPCWRNLHGLITPKYIREDLNKYTQVCYYRALVSSGVADRASAVKKTSIVSLVGPGTYVEVGGRYEFPGGATASRGAGTSDFWFGTLMADIPPSKP